MEILQRSLSEIATSIPGASGVLRSHHINFCIEGDALLSDVIRGDDEEQNALLQQIQYLMADNPVTDWSRQSAKEMITYVLQRFHDRHREQLPELIQMATKVERVHSESAACPHGLASLLRDMKYDLENHMQKEEQILFPMLAGGMYPGGPINVMQNEHEDHLRVIDTINQLTQGMEAPPGACGTWMSLYAGLRELVNDLLEHITLENYFLFTPRPHHDGGCCGSCQ